MTNYFYIFSYFDRKIVVKNKCVQKSNRSDMFDTANHAKFQVV